MKDDPIKYIQTDGGAVVDESVNIQSGDFVGRDKITINICDKSPSSEVGDIQDIQRSDGEIAISISDLEKERNQYLERLQNILEKSGKEKSTKSAETYAEIEGKDIQVNFLGDIKIRLQKQQLLFNPNSKISEFSAVFKILDINTEYESIPELSKELLKTWRQTKSISPNDRRMLIYGNPGSGKSRICEHLTWLMTKEAQEDCKLPLPVLIDFRRRELSELLENLPDEFSESDLIFDLANRAIGGTNPEPGLKKSIQSKVKSEDIFFIIDSVNEVALDNFRQLWDAITHFISSGQSANCGFVIAIREYAVQSDWSKWGKYIAICSLDDKQIGAFASLYLEPRKNPPTQQFIHWLTSNSQSSPPVIARNPFYLVILTKWYNAKKPKENDEVPKSRNLLEHDIVQRLNATSCPEDKKRTLTNVLSQIAFHGTQMGHVGTSIPFSDIKSHIKSTSTILGELLNYATESGLVDIYKIDNQVFIRFYHQRLQEYFAAHHLVKYQDRLCKDRLFSNVHWGDTIRLAVSISKEPEKIIEKIYGNPKRKALTGPSGEEYYWPLRESYPKDKRSFDTTKKLAETLWIESERFLLALSCLTEIEPAPFTVQDDGKFHYTSKVGKLADRLFDASKSIFREGAASLSLIGEGILVAQVLGDLSWPGATRALRVCFQHDLYSSSGGIYYYDTYPSVKFEAIKSLIRQSDNQVQEAQELLGWIKSKKLSLFIKAVLDGLPLKKQIRELLYLFFPKRKTTIPNKEDALRKETGSAITSKILEIGAGIIGLAIITVVILGIGKLLEPVVNAVYSWKIWSSFQNTFSKNVEKIGFSIDAVGKSLEPIGHALEPVGDFIGPIVGWGFILMIIVAIFVGITQYFKGFLDSQIDKIKRRLEQLDSSQKNKINITFHSLWLDFKETDFFKLIYQLRISILLSIILSPFGVPTLVWSFDILSLRLDPTNVVTLDQSYLFLTAPNNIIEWFLQINNVPIALLLSSIPIFWALLWMFEFPRSVLKTWVETREKLLDNSIFERLFQIPIVAFLLFPCGSAFLYYFQVYKIYFSQNRWFVESYLEIIQNSPSTYIILGLMILQLLIPLVLIISYWFQQIRLPLQMRKVKNLGKNHIGKLVFIMNNEKEWHLVRLNALKNLWYLGHFETIGEIQTLLLKFERSPSKLVRSETAQFRSQIRSAERFITIT
jgi:hypothetical protein